MVTTMSLDCDSSYTVDDPRTEKSSSCKNSKCFGDTAGLWPHVLVAAQTKSELKRFINCYKKAASNKLGKMVRGNLPNQLGGNAGR